MPGSLSWRVHREKQGNCQALLPLMSLEGWLVNVPTHGLQRMLLDSALRVHSR